MKFFSLSLRNSVFYTNKAYNFGYFLSHWKIIKVVITSLHTICGQWLTLSSSVWDQLLVPLTKNRARDLVLHLDALSFNEMMHKNGTERRAISLFAGRSFTLLISVSNIDVDLTLRIMILTLWFVLLSNVRYGICFRSLHTISNYPSEDHNVFSVLDEW